MFTYEVQMKSLYQSYFHLGPFSIKWNLSLAETIGTSKSVRYREVSATDVLLKLARLLQIPAPQCIETAHSYSPIGQPLIKLVKWIKDNLLSLHHIFKKNESKNIA